LVLDLDHTLIHAAVEHDLKNKGDQGPEIYRFTLPPNPTNYFIKLRPGLMAFLHDLKDIYELHIYTMGTKQYATRIAEIIDRTGEMFQEHRIVSRDDVEDMNSKNLERLFACENTMVVIVDDREDVWISGDQVSPNLLKIAPFHYFNTVREVNELPKDKVAPKTEVKDKPEEQPHGGEDSALASMRRLLVEIYNRFYSDSNNIVRDVKDIIVNIKRQVLKDCVILFSGLIPINEPPEKSELWRIATKFGAECRNDFSDEITHVVANKSGTSKVNQALHSSGTYLVNVKWLTESTRTWERVSEYDHPLDNFPVFAKGEGGPPMKKSKKEASVAPVTEEENQHQGEDEMDLLLEQQLMEELEGEE